MTWSLDTWWHQIYDTTEYSQVPGGVGNPGMSGCHGNRVMKDQWLGSVCLISGHGVGVVKRGEGRYPCSFC